MKQSSSFTHFKRVGFLSLFMTLHWISPLFAQEAIIRNWNSPRNTGMGNVRLTTGLYEENFFNNPARVTANPKSQFSLLGMSLEANQNTIQLAQSASTTKDYYQLLKQNIGEPFHLQFLSFFPSYYLATNENRDWAFAIGLLGNLQTDFNFRNSYFLELQTILDLGPAITFGKKFLEDKALSVGINGHLNYRASVNPDYSLVNYIQNSPFSISQLGGESLNFNLDLGATYKILEFNHFELQTGFSMQNLLGNLYGVKKFNLLHTQGNALPFNRSYGFGFSLYRSSIAFLSDNLIALELTDIGNNASGSFFRLFHLGLETYWKSLGFRTGINQGYLTVGLSAKLSLLVLHFSVYSEELGLNAGRFQDERYAFSMSLNL